jgi:DNA-binding YbaB/EbfC family protein
VSDASAGAGAGAGSDPHADRDPDDQVTQPNPLTLDMSALLEQAQQMQQQLMQVQAEAAEQIVHGHAGGGVVTVEVSGGMEFRKITIDPKAVDPADVEMLEDLVLAAIRDAVANVQELNQQALGGLGGLLGG